ncbi:NAD(P)H-quinone oxidoreductase [Pajaroellobacter abortibovis]|nr:NAD(P)H-quinone oxidoreductase [Pajaroellobacter abortibovis]
MITKFGGPEVLELKEIPTPIPSPEEIRVRVRAIGINRADLAQREGLYPAPAGVHPMIPGLEFSGEVEALGEQVTSFQQGERVLGLMPGGAYAEYICIHASLVARIPPSLDWAEAAAIPEAFVTAYDAMILQAGVSKGEIVLIHAAGSGVGTAAIQLAKQVEAYCIGTSRSVSKLEQAYLLGMDFGILVKNTQFAQEVIAHTTKGTDVILELVGGNYLPEDIRCIAPRGRILLIGLLGGRQSTIDLGVCLSKRIHIKGTVLRSRSFQERRELAQHLQERILPLFEDKKISPVLEQTFPFEQAAHAQEVMRNGLHLGKLVLTLSISLLLFLTHPVLDAQAIEVISSHASPSSNSAFPILSPLSPAEKEILEFSQEPFYTIPSFRKPQQICSLNYPVCIHSDAEVTPTHLLSVLDSIENAWSTATGPLGLPPPDIDWRTDAYPIYLVNQLETGAETSIHLRTDFGGIDRSSAFTVLDKHVQPDCTMDWLLARELARAILWRLSPSTDSATARSQSSFWSWLMTFCPMPEEDIAGFQSCPEHALADPWDESELSKRVSFSRGAALFYRWLDTHFGSGLGTMIQALWTLSATHTPPQQGWWDSNPNTFDVLRATFKNRLSQQASFDDILLQFAIARPFLGAASDPFNLPEMGSLGEVAHIQPAWDISWPERPRRLASPRGISPTGAAYIRVDTHTSPPGASLRIELEWESYARMKWAIVKSNSDGSSQSQLLIPSYENATEAQTTVSDLGGTAVLWIIGLALGEPHTLFHPETSHLEPHGWMLTLASYP